ncbi:hypothetical protein KDL01_08165 [Actinospica durhamensis]|uniref:Uncharacterized protein n=1 Tax=Actinospica durhamensis TaxID=1508375 RepID=A0A941EKY2_9ACTN|nr:hypothetical protein [Actinospica durhamensis]MBR7833236.1 hypothetical protein [Actinospica durhamensis]
MNEQNSDEFRIERDLVRDARDLPLSRLADCEYDAARTTVVDRLIRTEAARVAVSAFSSSI